MFTALLLTASLGIAQAAPAYEWKATDDTDQLALYRDGAQVGVYQYADTCRYLPVVGRQADGRVAWGLPIEPPVMPPYRPRNNFGVDFGKVQEFSRNGAGGQVYSHDGRIVSRDAALKLLTPPQAGGDKLPNDSKLPRLTLIGTADDCKRVRADLDVHPLLTPYKGQVLIQDYRPGDVMVARVVPAAVLGGTPTVYLQKPNGVVLWREQTYSGPDALAGVLRRTRPDYDPSKDPGPGNPMVAGVALSPEFLVIALIVVIAAAAVYYLRPNTARSTALWSR